MNEGRFYVSNNEMFIDTKGDTEHVKLGVVSIATGCNLTGPSSLHVKFLENVFDTHCSLKVMKSSGEKT